MRRIQWKHNIGTHIVKDENKKIIKKQEWGYWKNKNTNIMEERIRTRIRSIKIE